MRRAYEDNDALRIVEEVQDMFDRRTWNESFRAGAREACEEIARRLITAHATRKDPQ